MFYVEELVRAVVHRLQHLFVLLCLLQLHIFALTVIIRLIYSVTVQMHSGHYCRSIQQLLEKGPLLCCLHHPLKQVNSEIICGLRYTVVLLLLLLLLFLLFMNITVKPCN